MFYELKYFKKSGLLVIHDEDFNNRNKVVILNLEHVISISDKQEYWRGSDHVGDYHYIVISNGDIYFVSNESYLELTDLLRLKGNVLKLNL